MPLSGCERPLVHLVWIQAIHHILQKKNAQLNKYVNFVTEEWRSEEFLASHGLQLIRQPVNYPLTAPSVNPEIRYLLNARKSSTTGIETRREPAA